MDRGERNANELVRAVNERQSSSAQNDAGLVFDVLVPQLTANDDIVVLVRWLKADGAAVREGEPICELETAKAAYELPAPASGILTIAASPGELRVGERLGRVGPRKEDLLVTSGEDVLEGTTRFSRSARELLSAHGVPDSAFAGRELVTREDVLQFLGESGSSPVRSVDPSAARVRPRSRRKRAEIRVLEGGRQALASAIFVERPVSGLLAQAHRDPSSAGFSLLAVVVREAGRLLREYPELNAAYRPEGDRFYDAVNIGIAFDLPGHGLKVPVMRAADQRALKDVVLELHQLQQAYASDRLHPDTLREATFTISDLSSEGPAWFIPLIAEDQAAILALTYAGGTAGAGALRLVLVFDHRVSEGRRAATFLRELLRRIALYDRATASATCARCARAVEQIKAAGGLLLRAFDGNADVWLCSSCAASRT